VHDADYGIGGPEPSPWDPRFVNGMFGTDSLIQIGQTHSA
jgi:hypothetical protein